MQAKDREDEDHRDQHKHHLDELVTLCLKGLHDDEDRGHSFDTCQWSDCPENSEYFEEARELSQRYRDHELVDDLDEAAKYYEQIEAVHERTLPEEALLIHKKAIGNYFCNDFEREEQRERHHDVV